MLAVGTALLRNRTISCHPCPGGTSGALMTVTITSFAAPEEKPAVRRNDDAPDVSSGRGKTRTDRDPAATLASAKNRFLEARHLLWFPVSCPRNLPLPLS